MGNPESYDKLRVREPFSGDGQQKPSGGSGVFIQMGISDSPGSQQRIITTQAARHRGASESTGGDDIQWIYCRDNKYRPIKPGIFPLAPGISRGMVYGGDPGESINSTKEARAMRLKGYGNAIVPQLAAEFIRVFVDA